MILFNKFVINNKKWKQDLKVKSLYYRSEIVLFIIAFTLGLIIGVII
jgi:hypothetical protein